MAVIEVNNPIVANGGGTGRRIKRTQIAHAAILTLRGTPVTLVAAPGAGKAIAVNRVTLVLDVTTAGYTETDDDLVVEYSGGVDVLTIETTGFIDQATDQVRVISPAEALATPTANEALQLKNSGDGEFGAGNAANTLSVEVEYEIVPTIAFPTS